MTTERGGPDVGRRALLRLSGAGALAGGAALAAGEVTGHTSPERRLDGVWRSILTRTRPTPNPVLNRRPLTCFADGTALLGGAPVNPEGGRLIYRDTGSGEWFHTGDRRFNLGIVISNYAEDGGWLFETVVVMELTLEAGLDVLIGSYESQDVEVDGSVRGSRGGTISAERIRFPF